MICFSSWASATPESRSTSSTELFDVPFPVQDLNRDPKTTGSVGLWLWRVTHARSCIAASFQRRSVCDRTETGVTLMCAIWNWSSRTLLRVFWVTRAPDVCKSTVFTLFKSVVLWGFGRFGVPGSVEFRRTLELPVFTIISLFSHVQGKKIVLVKKAKKPSSWLGLGL